MPWITCLGYCVPMVMSSDEPFLAGCRKQLNAGETMRLTLAVRFMTPLRLTFLEHRGPNQPMNNDRISKRSIGSVYAFSRNGKPLR